MIDRKRPRGRTGVWASTRFWGLRRRCRLDPRHPARNRGEGEKVRGNEAMRAAEWIQAPAPNEPKDRRKWMMINDLWSIKSITPTPQAVTPTRRRRANLRTWRTPAPNEPENGARVRLSRVRPRALPPHDSPPSQRLGRVEGQQRGARTPPST